MPPSTDSKRPNAAELPPVKVPSRGRGDALRTNVAKNLPHLVSLQSMTSLMLMQNRPPVEMLVSRLEPATTNGPHSLQC